MVSIKVLGLDVVSERLRTAAVRYEESPGEIATQVGSLWLREMKAVSPRRTGRMADELSMTIGREGMRATVLYQGVDYTNFVIRGTRPHMIFPRVHRHLAFFVDGRRVFAWRVRHPGTRANDFPERGLRNIRSQVNEILRRVGARIVGGTG